MAFAISRPRHCGLTSGALLLLLTVVAVSGSTRSTLPVLKSATCDAFLYASLSDDGAKTSTNSTAISSDARRDSSTSDGVEDVPLSTPATEDRNVLDDTVAGQLGVVKPVADCEALLGIDLSGITEEGHAAVTSAAETIHEGTLYCSVEGTLPASTQWQVLLPVRTWTQRYMQIGCGGLCGNIRMQVNAAFGSRQVSGGEFVLAATDMGGAMDGKVFANNSGRRKSFAYSAHHLTALVSKTLIQAYYGQKPSYSYFNGCSDGGREGVMEAIRYPNDFDGIIAGAPAMLFQFQNSLHHGWLAMSNIDGLMPELPPHEAWSTARSSRA
ncbi:Tannase and feruloyl esterase [Phytophthora boehmeriae]|uniref:feruloyl esterase n=1 Tax=Phytophthora boehmeriae TaxID=109152 RepID=A0A8T1VRF9_9STRA|nr:Tannase and feruloyl esterase [Phytophthora boehmeriae]